MYDISFNIFDFPCFLVRQWSKLQIPKSTCISLFYLPLKATADVGAITMKCTANLRQREYGKQKTGSAIFLDCFPCEQGMTCCCLETGGVHS